VLRPGRHVTLFYVMFCSNLLFQILSIFAVFHSEGNCDCCCNVREDLKLYKQFLPALRRQCLKNLCFHLTQFDFSIIENLKSQEN
jgi:hypothetical protein